MGYSFVHFDDCRKGEKTQKTSTMYGANSGLITLILCPDFETSATTIASMVSQDTTRNEEMKSLKVALVAKQKELLEKIAERAGEERALGDIKLSNETLMKEVEDLKEEMHITMHQKGLEMKEAVAAHKLELEGLLAEKVEIKEKLSAVLSEREVLLSTVGQLKLDLASAMQPSEDKHLKDELLKKYESLEIENRHLMEQVTSLQRELSAKSEAFTVIAEEPSKEDKVDRLENELNDAKDRIIEMEES
jgi:chromosome segregation ATPase